MGVARPYLRDGVDVYVREDNEIHFVFLATRKRVVVKAHPYLVQSLSWLTGEETTAELAKKMAVRNGSRARSHFLAFIEYLERQGIVVERGWLYTSGLDSEAVATHARQLAFLLDVLGAPEHAITAQARILEARVVCFGAGAVGSWIIQLLVNLGFRRFTVVDHDSIAAADIARHGFCGEASAQIGDSKAFTLASCIRRLYPRVEIEAKHQSLSTTTRLDTLIADDVDLVINAADEPYVGYTSVLLSRYCAPKRLPLLVAGGFDAHLASVGELIIPGVTPCADCYADYFEEALADWKPVEHPVANRGGGSGGLCSLSVFAAGAAVMEALQLFTGHTNPRCGRGEFHFDDYRLDSFSVKRSEDCRVCSVL